MMKIEDVSKAHRTILRTKVQDGRARVTLEVCVLGRDAWAYQSAKIELTNRVIAARRAAA